MDISTADPFFGPYLKVDRAYHHIAELEGIFKTFLDTQKDLLSGKPDDNPREDGRRVIGAGFPVHTPTVLGDAVHNLRAALDHTYCALVEANGMTPNSRTYFPFSRDANGVKGAIHGSKKPGKPPHPKPAKAIRACILDEVQPYDGGKLGLYSLHLLDRTDKHSVLIPAALTMTAGTMEITTGHGKRVTWHGGTFIATHGKPHTSGFINIGAGGTVKDVGETKTAFSISFGKGQPFEDESVIRKLNDLGTTVRAVLGMLKPRV